MPRYVIYLAHAQFPLDYWRHWSASTASPSIAPMRAALEALDPDVPLFHPSTMAHLAEEAVSRSRFVMLLLEDLRDRRYHDGDGRPLRRDRVLGG